MMTMGRIKIRGFQTKFRKKLTIFFPQLRFLCIFPLRIKNDKSSISLIFCRTKFVFRLAK